MYGVQAPHQSGLSKIPLTCIVSVCPLSMDLFVSRWYKHTNEGCMLMKAGMKGVPTSQSPRKRPPQSHLQRADPVWNQGNFCLLAFGEKLESKD